MSFHVHFIAICGTAMATLAGMLKEKGFHVTGSDQNVYPPMSDQLKKWGIEIQQGFRAENLNPLPNLVIVGNAVSKTNPEVEALLQSKIRYLSLPQAIGEFFLKEKKSLVVAGTHGKTTTTSLLAWMLYSLKSDPSFLVGGIPENFHSSYRLGKGDFFAIEGDEYDSAFFDKGPKFWHYQPNQAIITGVEFDHADIYRDLDHLMNSFQKFVELIPPNGKLFLSSDNENVLKLNSYARCPIITYGLNHESDIRAEQIVFDRDGVEFALFENRNKLGVFRSPLSGKHNLQNLLGVLALCLNLGFAPETLQAPILEFKGVKRRQEIRGVVNGITVIDDFAHHPTAVLETIDAIRNRYPNQKIWVVFEPRSNTSRRSIFQNDFVKAFLHADETIIADVFMPEKVKDVPLLNVNQLIQEIHQQGGKAVGGMKVEEIVSYLGKNVKSHEVILIMSNGGFENIHERLLERLQQSSSS